LAKNNNKSRKFSKIPKTLPLPSLSLSLSLARESRFEVSNSNSNGEDDRSGRVYEPNTIPIFYPLSNPFYPESTEILHIILTEPCDVLVQLAKFNGGNKL